MGGGPDIDAVFDIEEELESEAEMRQSQFLSPSQLQAQGQQNDEEPAASQLLQPFLTDSSAATTSASTPAATTTPTAAASFPRSPSPTAQSSSSPTSSHLHLGALPESPLQVRPRRRSRLYSQMSRPDVHLGPPVASSPLTQLYQPLVVELEEDIPEDSVVALPSGARRRLSMHRRNATEPLGIAVPVLARRTAAGGGALSASRPADSSMPFSESPRAAGEAEVHDSGPADLATRLGAIEERQARIEDLLQRLVTLQSH